MNQRVLIPRSSLVTERWGAHSVSADRIGKRDPMSTSFQATFRRRFQFH
jgi:hypothetical protein